MIKEFNEKYMLVNEHGNSCIYAPRYDRILKRHYYQRITIKSFREFYANRLVQAQRIDPCMSEVYAWSDIPKAHMKMWKNEHRPGNMAVLVSAPHTGLKTFEDVIEASAS